MHIFEKAGLGKAPYTYLGCVDTGRTSSSCQFCNTGIRYLFKLESADKKVFIVGSDCIYKTNDTTLVKTVKKARREIIRKKAEEERQKKYEDAKAQREQILKEKIENFYKENETITYVFDWAKNSTGTPLNIINKVNTWGNLTEKQIELLCSLYYDAHKIKTPCPKGKVTIEGTIVSLKWQDYMLKPTQKMLVETKEGFRVFGTVPGNLEKLVKGDRVRFVATVNSSHQDETFGFYTRPTKAEYLGASE